MKRSCCSSFAYWLQMIWIVSFRKTGHSTCSKIRCGSRGGPGGPGPPLTLGFEAPKLSIFGPYLIFPLIFFASLRSAYYFFNMLLFQSSNSKIFQPRFTRHMISHLEVFVFSLSFTHFRLLGVHLSLSFF